MPDLHSIAADECNEAFAVPNFLDRLIIIGAIDHLRQLDNVALSIPALTPLRGSDVNQIYQRFGGNWLR